MWEALGKLLTGLVSPVARLLAPGFGVMPSLEASRSRDEWADGELQLKNHGPGVAYRLVASARAMGTYSRVRLSMRGVHTRRKLKPGETWVLTARDGATSEVLFLTVDWFGRDGSAHQTSFNLRSGEGDWLEGS